MPTPRKYFYERFLENKHTYALTRNYWRRLFVQTVGEQVEHNFWLQRQYANGEDFGDGNPIFNTRLAQRPKAVRIIMLDAKSPLPEFSFWVERKSESAVDELVLALKLFKESRVACERIFKAWVVEDLNASQIVEVAARVRAELLD